MIKKIIIISLLILAALLFYSYMKNISQVSQPDLKLKQEEKGLTLEAYLKKVDRKDKLVLVYFHADWCVPCIKLKPEIDKLALELKNNCEIIFIDVDDNPTNSG